MNKQVVLNILRAELHVQEENLLFHKAEIAYMWDLCDPKYSHRLTTQINFARLNSHKEMARQTRRKLKAIRDSIKTIKSVVGIISL
jgi:hypothetical protein